MRSPHLDACCCKFSPHISIFKLLQDRYHISDSRGTSPLRGAHALHCTHTWHIHVSTNKHKWCNTRGTQTTLTTQPTLTSLQCSLPAPVRYTEINFRSIADRSAQERRVPAVPGVHISRQVTHKKCRAQQHQQGSKSHIPAVYSGCVCWQERDKHSHCAWMHAVVVLWVAVARMQ